MTAKDYLCNAKRKTTENMGNNAAGADEMRYHYKYPHPAVTTDCVVFAIDGGTVSVLLVRRGNEPHKGRWAFPGGFLNIDEHADAGVLRELEEETGLRLTAARQFHTFTQPDRDPRERVISIAYYAVTRRQAVAGGDDAADARWFSTDALPPLAFDHAEMLRKAAQALLLQMPQETRADGTIDAGLTLAESRALRAAAEKLATGQE